MRFTSFTENGIRGLGVRTQGGLKGLTEADSPKISISLDAIIAEGGAALATVGEVLAAQGRMIDEAAIAYRPLLERSGKILCIGLNYRDHTKETGMEQPDYPTVFARFASSLSGHGAPLIRPTVSEAYDFEGELALVIGKRGRNIAEADALDYIAGYAPFNDVSLRDFQMKTSQWTVGKNFDGTGPFGPELVTPDELPIGCEGLTLTTRLNGEIVQQALIDDMIFSIARLISTLSIPFALEPGDIIVTGTPAGVGMARTPPLWMKHGDVVEVEIEKVGLLRNHVVDES